MFFISVIALTGCTKDPVITGVKLLRLLSLRLVPLGFAFSVKRGTDGSVTLLESIEVFNVRRFCFWIAGLTEGRLYVAAGGVNN